MAQNKSSKNSRGVCKKIRTAVSECPIKTTIHHISHKPDQPLPKTKGWTRTSPTPNKPVHVLPHSKTIPIEFEPHILPFSSAQMNVKTSGNSVGTKPLQNFAKRDIVIAEDQNTIDHVHVQQAPIRVPIAKAKTKKDDGLIEDHEVKFSDYISKVKRRMIETKSNIDGRSATRRDSFNYKVMDYINRARIKIRTTTNVAQSEKTTSFK